MLQIKIKTSQILSSILAITLLGFIFLPKNTGAVEYKLDNVDTIETWQLNQDINEKRSEIQELRRQIDVYKKNIDAKQRQLGNLATQISTLNESIAKINLEIQATELEMDALNLEIENTQLKIDSKEKEITEQKDVLAEVIRSLHRQQQKNNLLEILILNDNFSDFIADLNNLEDMRDNLFDGVGELNKIKIALSDDKNSIENEKTELDTLKSILDNKKGSLDGQKTSKSTLMAATQGQEAKYQTLLHQAKEEQEQANSDIVYLEQIAREKVNRQLELDNITSDGLMWPVTSQRVTAYFHDPDYPYRYIFEHPAIDIATPQGTPLRAAESGYVAKAKDGGATGYSYIMLIHADGLSTVYGHINSISVSADQFVSKGDIIGYTGGMPGTYGAGPLTTGPHLHLEVRLNGVPVDPLNYLP
ncbi:MAG: peptidoglycan DD-metalloendopeptidase family protein [Patescibacteria group bacterium]|jgi:murein DD-endopeptidase MepM/ murein hydrolase activator NlpD